ncbi:protein EDS1L-like [Zingiber officinale]|uniref:Enhanced disease susceptibility 1 n=1 Tax=Zingiber officinale TaxID=94328 RepID=A0A8J5HWL1_ZINOF|nr:protein EDS1L-like [Zingiber officinale]KAG6537157.1 hypothetical protein ZIOFF_002242 [Zingiber officinale]
MAKKDSSRHGLVDTMLSDSRWRALIPLCCSLSMAANHSPSSPFLRHHSADSSVFAFPASWSSDDWILPGARSHFGETDVDAALFPSIKSVGNDAAAAVNGAFLRFFKNLLEISPLSTEVQRAASEKKQIMFTGHSSGGSIAVLATIWFLEQNRKFNISHGQADPFCITFGTPLVGDGVFVHALQREDWARLFLHFVMLGDIVPRCLMSPLSNLDEEFQGILHFLCPKPMHFSSKPAVSSLVTFYRTVLRNALSISNHQACFLMGCTNPLLEVLTGFVKFTPYRPFGTYAFHSSDDDKLIYLKNSNSILHLLFYFFQRDPEQDVEEIAQRSLEEHLLYEVRIKRLFDLQNTVSMHSLDAIPLSFSDALNEEAQSLETLLKEIDLSSEARLHLHAAAEWENQRLKNQAKVDSNYNKIQESLNFLKEYRATCELRGRGYYDTFKLQKDVEDFNTNVKRLELAGLWDEIVEMLRRYELPDGFDGRKEWVNLGTQYRRLVEPLDIANYYRHSKNEDTGPYMVKGRPKRYRYTQRWLEHAERAPASSSVESCFWASVEELCIETGDNKPFPEVKTRVLELEQEVLRWVNEGKLGRDVFLSDSTFAKWWMTLPLQHRLGSCIAKFMNVEDMLGKSNQ